MKIPLVGVSSVAIVVLAGLAAPAAAAVIDGTSGPDDLAGTRSADTIRGYAGNDTLRGRGGADSLDGGRGDDTLFGGKDLRKDRLYGGPGTDRISVRTRDAARAGTGKDTLLVNRPRAGVTKVDCGPGMDSVTVTHSKPTGWLVPWAHACESFYWKS